MQQRQRVVLAQALACNPALLIADEPAASLDARSQSELLALLRELQRELRISILLISHAPEVQASLADRLMVMANGRIVEQGPFEQLYRNPSHGSELNDISMSAPPPCPTCAAAYVNQHTAAMLDQHTAAMLDGSQYAAFGHGTMVMGVIHLVAPTAKLLPLKSFSANGNGSLSNILAAIYYAVQNHVSVINMSFDLTTSSTELSNAINYANSHNVIMAASSGNDGKQEMVYPAGLQNVMGVASTNNQDQRSTFSNYGNQIVWVAAPGEGVITTYPFATYAAGWGTSFSSPMVAGTASLLVNMQSTSENQESWAIAHAKWIGLNMGNGRLDVYGSLAAFNPLQGLLQ